MGCSGRGRIDMRREGWTNPRGERTLGELKTNKDLLNENPSDCLASWGCAGRSGFLFGVVRDRDAVEILGESAGGRAGGGDGARVAVCGLLRGAFAGDDRGEVDVRAGGGGFWGVVCAVGAVLVGCAAPGLGGPREGELRVRRVGDLRR